MGASSRLRSIQYVEPLKGYGIFLDVKPLISNSMLKLRYKNKRYLFFSLVRAYLSRIYQLWSAKNYDFVIIEKEMLPWATSGIEKFLLIGSKYILDFDDATFHKYDQHRFSFVRFVWGKKLDYLMNSSAAVICGNTYLQDRAILAGSKRVEFLPTVVDFNKYKEVAYNKPYLADTTIKIVWIGTPETEKYLQVISEVLEKLSKKYDLELNLIGGKLFSSEYFKVKHLDWSAEFENHMLAECHIGVMPLFKGSWELGKCGYKLVQYLASGLPAVGTAIGANKNILQHGENGYLVLNSNEWYGALENLILNPALRNNMGKRGREIAKKHFSLKSNAEILANYLKDI